MGLAPVQGTVTQAVKATNTGEVAVHCTWEAGQPFSIVPDSASIEANQSFTFTCRFQPPEASVFTVLAACRADTGYTATMKVGMTPLVDLYQHMGLCFAPIREGVITFAIVGKVLATIADTQCEPSILLLTDICV